MLLPGRIGGDNESVQSKKGRSSLKKYEALFILDTGGKEDGEKEILERIQKDIEHTGGRVETVQKMGSRPFARTTQKRTAGYYANVIFQAPPTAINELNQKFHLASEVFRWQFTEPTPEAPVREPRAESATARE
jgi:ribosomal protein S6